MSKGIGIIIVIAVVIIGAIMWGTGIYNNLVGLDEGVTSAWSQVENQYQRRADLIPNLVSTVKGVAEFERGTFTDVTEARAKVNQINMSPDMLSDPNAFSQFQTAQDGLGSALSRLLVTVEKYPIWKANENYYGGRPNFDYVIVKVIPTKTAAYFALKAGDITS